MALNGLGLEVRHVIVVQSVGQVQSQGPRYLQGRLRPARGHAGGWHALMAPASLLGNGISLTPFSCLPVYY